MKLPNLFYEDKKPEPLFNWKSILIGVIMLILYLIWYSGTSEGQSCVQPYYSGSSHLIFFFQLFLAIVILLGVIRYLGDDEK